MEDLGQEDLVGLAGAVVGIACRAFESQLRDDLARASELDTLVDAERDQAHPGGLQGLAAAREPPQLTEPGLVAMAPESHQERSAGEVEHAAPGEDEAGQRRVRHRQLVAEDDAVHGTRDGLHRSVRARECTERLPSEPRGLRLAAHETPGAVRRDPLVALDLAVGPADLDCVDALRGTEPHVLEQGVLAQVAVAPTHAALDHAAAGFHSQARAHRVEVGAPDPRAGAPPTIDPPEACGSAGAAAEGRFGS